MINNEFDLFFAEINRFVISTELNDALVCQSVVIFAHENVSPCKLMKFSNAFSIVTYYKGRNPIRYRDKCVRAWERIDFELFFELALLLGLLLESALVLLLESCKHVLLVLQLLSICQRHLRLLLLDLRLWEYSRGAEDARLRR